MINEWDDYAKEWEESPQVVQYSKLAFKSLSRIVELDGLHILDFGCGTGLLSEQLSPKAKKIVSLDPSTKMIQVLKNKNLPNVIMIDRILTKDLIESSALFSMKFDLIVASSVCGFLPNYVETLKLIKSMLIQNGVFVQWDWLANKDNSEIGLTMNEIEFGFKEAKLELSSLTEPFSMEHEGMAMPVIMAVGKNYYQ